MATATPSMPKTLTQPSAPQSSSARPTPTAVANGSSGKPRKETPAPATELAVVRNLTGHNKWHLRGRILGHGHDVVPTQVWRGLTQRPVGADIREITESGQLDNALAWALAWEKRHTAGLVAPSTPSAPPATPATIVRTIHTGAERASALSAREQAIVDRLLAERDATPQVVDTRPPASQLGLVKMTADELAEIDARLRANPLVDPARVAQRAARHTAAKTKVNSAPEVSDTPTAPEEQTMRPARTKRRGKRQAEARRILDLAHAIDLEALRANSPENAKFVDSVLALSVDELASQANAWMSQTVAFLSKLTNIIRARQLAGKISLNALREIKPDAAALVDTVLGASFEELVAQPDAWISQAEQSLTILAKD